VTAPRTPVLAGNWKMNLGPAAAASFFADFLGRHPAREDATVLFFPPAISFSAAREALKGRGDVRLGVQNVYWEAGGAFTGELSVPMAAEAGAEYVLIGHSERRHVFGETVTQTVRKVRAVLDGGLVPLLCVGETLDERRAGRAEAVVEGQLVPVLATLTRERGGALRHRLRAGVGDRHRRDGDGGRRGGDARQHPRPARPLVRARGGRRHPDPVRRKREAGERRRAPRRAGSGRRPGGRSEPGSAWLRRDLRRGGLTKGP
jgi:hypothetical protein